MSNKPRVLSYVRMSTDSQKDSPTYQRQQIAKLIEDCDYYHAGEQSDEGISGWKRGDKRPGFRRLRELAEEHGNIDGIVCDDLDRFSRATVMQTFADMNALAAAGVKFIHTAAQGRHDLNEGDGIGQIIKLVVDVHGSHEYSKKLGRRVCVAKVRDARAGKWIAGATSYGYLRQEGGIVVAGEAEQVQTVRWLFAEYAGRDVGLQELAIELNNRGIPAPSGKRWTRSAVHTILRREAYYTGELRQLQQKKSQFFSAMGGDIQAAGTCERSEGVSVKCPALVDEAVGKLVASKLSERKHRTTPKANGGRALLTGMLYCSHCGQRMTAVEVPRNHKKSKTRKDLIYCCSTYHALGSKACHRNPIHEAAILDFLIPAILDKVLAPENFSRLEAAIGRKLKTRKRQKTDDGRQDAARLTKIDREVEAAVKELRRTPDDLYELAVAELRKLRAQRAKLADAMEARRIAQETRGGDGASEASKALAMLHGLRERVRDANPQVAREALRRIVERIDLEFEHVHHKKITRAVFQRGIAKFNCSQLVGTGWPEIAQLPDIGETLAKRIVDSRNTQGPFHDHDDLRRVRGIGAKTLDGMRPYLLPMPNDETLAGQ